MQCPTAYENDAERAILAGLAILQAVGTLKTAADVAVQTRIAIGSGVVVVGDLVRQGVTQENAAIGETMNLVARLQAIAEPNSLVISHRLVGALFDYRDLGRHSLKGFSKKVHVRQVLGPSKVESRFEAQHQSGTSALLGREKERGLLLRWWDEIGPASLAESVENDLAAQTVNSAFLSFPFPPFRPTPTAADVVVYSSAEKLRGTGDYYA